MPTGKTWGGYEQISLWANGNSLTTLVHRLVALAFVPQTRPDQVEVNHKNGDKSDNSAPNLEWLTRRENREHAIRTGLLDVNQVKRLGLSNRGSSHPKSRLNELDIVNIRKQKGAKPVKEIAKEYGVSPVHVYKILDGSRWNQGP